MNSVCEMIEESSHTVSGEDTTDDASNLNDRSSFDTLSSDNKLENETCDSDEKPGSVVKFHNHKINVDKIIREAYTDWEIPYKVLDRIYDIEVRLIWNHDKMFEKLNRNKTTTVKIKRSFQKVEVELVFKRWLNFCKLFNFDSKKPNYFYHSPVSSKLLSKYFIKYFTSFITQDLCVTFEENVVLWNFQCLFEEGHKMIKYSDYDDAIIQVFHEKLNGNTAFTNYIIAHCLNKSYKSVVKRRCKLRNTSDQVKSYSNEHLHKKVSRKQKETSTLKLSKSNLESKTKALKQTRLSFVRKTNFKSEKDKISEAQSSESDCESTSKTDNITNKKELKSVSNVDQPMNPELCTFSKDNEGELLCSGSDSESETDNFKTVQLDTADKVEMTQETDIINGTEYSRNVDMSPGKQEHLMNKVKRPLANLKKIEESSKVMASLIDSILKVKQLARPDIDKLSIEPISVQEWFEIANDCKQLAAHQAKAVYDSHIYPVLFSPVDQYQLICDIIRYLRKEELVKWEDIKWSEVSSNMSNMKPLFLFCAFANFVNQHVPLQLHHNFKDCLDYLSKEKLPFITDKSIDGFVEL